MTQNIIFNAVLENQKARQLQVKVGTITRNNQEDR